MKWIDCFEAMPPKHEDVLVWVVYQNKTVDSTISCLNDDGWEMGSAKGFIVTHWMKIEEPI